MRVLCSKADRFDDKDVTLYTGFRQMGRALVEYVTEDIETHRVLAKLLSD